MLAYRLAGQGPPVTFLHGFTQRGSSWDELIGLLPPRWSWLQVDLPGHGDSPDQPISLPATATALHQLWDQLGWARSHLVGYSLGGRLALWLATLDRGRLLSLAAIGAHAGLEGEARQRRLAEDSILADHIETRGIEWLADYWGKQSLFAGLARRGPDFLASIQASRRRNRAQGLAASLRAAGGGATEPFWDRLGKIEVPTLLVAGAEDSRYVEMATRLGNAIPQAEVAIVPEAGHVVHLEQPAAVARLLKHFLRDHWSRR
jgi:2-succinyl-6-hydroxy-2,4-cyclohexadiene-1-carboxylate synthase